MKRALYIIPLTAILVAGVAWVNTPYWRVDDMVVEDTSEMQGAVTISGKTTLDGELNIDSADVSLTSPTTTIDVAGKNRIVVTSDVAQTGITLTSGEEDQQVTLIGTNDSNTVQVDDGANYDIGGNKALGANDVLSLYTLDGSAWFAVDYLDN